MVLVSYSGREINAKIVYYGPGLSGKTTNLESIFSSVPEGNKGRMVSVKTKTERTLFFDFLPVNLGELAGFKTRFLLYTVPGQVYYNATRKLVLKGVDAVVFVADSQRGKMDENVESLQNLKENLREQGLSIDDIPWSIQYNKRDLPNVMSIDEMQRVLNPTGVPWFEAVATTGEGVLDTFKAISRLLLRHLSEEIGVQVVTPAPPGSQPEADLTAEILDQPEEQEEIQPIMDEGPEEVEEVEEAVEAVADLQEMSNIPSKEEMTPIEPSLSVTSQEIAKTEAEPEETAYAPSNGFTARFKRWFSKNGQEEAPAKGQAPAEDLPQEITAQKTGQTDDRDLELKPIQESIPLGKERKETAETDATKEPVRPLQPVAGWSDPAGSKEGSEEESKAEPEQVPTLKLVEPMAISKGARMAPPDLRITEDRLSDPTQRMIASHDEESKEERMRQEPPPPPPLPQNVPPPYAPPGPASADFQPQEIIVPVVIPRRGSEKQIALKLLIRFIEEEEVPDEGDDLDGREFRAVDLR
ncbi:MAG: hypothetical protein KJ970_18710 [Candidatus Eisenbacteria bacterium]|uniref:GTPase domain-containing protein n=1 Tax=Eiseniibacteriota bacterium TaxID=2212470 RepID=A0A948S0I0_UNCEI|nr:hypothetical protein [Candidatus Eisenbacteria bacterium]MBU2692954.1 hypothetical protein [Candidatus Eisenbacteria bacterium]